MKIPKFKCSGIGIIAKFRLILTGFSNQDKNQEPSEQKEDATGLPVDWGGNKLLGHCLAILLAIPLSEVQVPQERMA